MDQQGMNDGGAPDAVPQQAASSKRERDQGAPDSRLASAKELAHTTPSSSPEDTQQRGDQQLKRTLQQRAGAQAGKGQQGHARNLGADQQGQQSAQHGALPSDAPTMQPPAAAISLQAQQEAASAVRLSEPWPLPGGSQVPGGGTPVSGARGSPSSTSGEPKQQRLPPVEDEAGVAWGQAQGTPTGIPWVAPMLLECQHRAEAEAAAAAEQDALREAMGSEFSEFVHSDKENITPLSFPSLPIPSQRLSGLAPVPELAETAGDVVVGAGTGTPVVMITAAVGEGGEGGGAAAAADVVAVGEHGCDAAPGLASHAMFRTFSDDEDAHGGTLHLPQFICGRRAVTVTTVSPLPIATPVPMGMASAGGAAPTSEPSNMKPPGASSPATEVPAPGASHPPAALPNALEAAGASDIALGAVGHMPAAAAVPGGASSGNGDTSAGAAADMCEAARKVWPPASPHTLEEGRVYFLYRPKVGVLEPRELRDVQRFDVLLERVVPPTSTPAVPPPSKGSEAHAGASSPEALEPPSQAPMRVVADAPTPTNTPADAGGGGGGGGDSSAPPAGPTTDATVAGAAAALRGESSRARATWETVVGQVGEAPAGTVEGGGEALAKEGGGAGQASMGEPAGHAISRPAVRLITVSRKHLPSTQRHERLFAYVSAVGSSVNEVLGQVGQGQDGGPIPVQPSGGPMMQLDETCVGSGVYTLYTYKHHEGSNVRGPSATRLAYMLEHPDTGAEEGGPLKELGVASRGVFVVSVKNPEFIGEEGAPYAGLNPQYTLQQVQGFKGERWAGAEDTSLLDEVGAELLLIGARTNPPAGTMRAAVKHVGHVEPPDAITPTAPTSTTSADATDAQASVDAGGVGGGATGGQEVSKD